MRTAASARVTRTRSSPSSRNVVWPSKVAKTSPCRAASVVRISTTDWEDGGWDVDQSVELARRLKELGVDLVDCSSGGNVATASIPVSPGYQVPAASRIRREAGIATGAVGLITSAPQANQILEDGHADCVLLARAMLRDPYWPLHAAQELGVPMDWPVQYQRAAPKDARAR